MVTYLQLLFRPLFDFKFAKKYTKEGKGSGVAIMGLVALIMIVLSTYSFTLNMPKDFNKETLNTEFNKMLDSLPEMVIKDGEFQWKDNVIEHYKLDRKSNLTIDTQNEAPTMNQLEGSAIYITKTDVYINNSKGKIQSFSWSDLQVMLDKNPLDLKSPESRKIIMSWVNTFIYIFAVFAIVFTFLAFWLANGILATFTRYIGEKVNAAIKNLEHFERRRMAAIATAPIMITIASCQFFFNQPGFWGKIIVTVIMGIALMSILIKKISQIKD